MLWNDCPYVRELYSRCKADSGKWFCLQPRFEEEAALHRTKRFDAYIDEYEELDWGKVLSHPHAIASQFCVRKSVCRKAELASHVGKYRRKCIDRNE